MAFASATDVQARSGQTFDAAQLAAAGAIVDDVTALIAEAVGKDDAWAAALSPVPNALKALTAYVTLRVLPNPSGFRAASEQIGTYTRDTDFSLNGFTLTVEEVRLARTIVYGPAEGSASTGELESIVDLIPLRFPTAWGWTTLVQLGQDDPASYLPTNDPGID